MNQNLQVRNKIPESIYENEEKKIKEYSPNNTIYISNLNQKCKINYLKETLHNVFQQFGQILQIIAKKNIIMRGQALIVYKDINSAMQAKITMNGKQLFGKSMIIQFAKHKSKIILEKEGYGYTNPKNPNWYKKRYEQKFVKKNEEKKNDKKKIQQKKPSIQTKVTFQKQYSNIPHHTLFVEGLTSAIKNDMLVNLFGQFIGFMEVRHIGAKNIAFVQFQDEIKAGYALSVLNDTQLGQVTLQISYAKK